MSPDRFGPFWVRVFTVHISSLRSLIHFNFFQFLSVPLFRSVVAPPPIFLSSSLLFFFFFFLFLFLFFTFKLLSCLYLPLLRFFLNTERSETTLLCSSRHRTLPHSSHPPTGRHSSRQSTPPHLCAPLQLTSQIHDKYDQSNAAQSSKKAKKSYKSYVWIHTRRLDIGKDGEPRVKCLGCGKVKMRIEERMLSS
ncbi:hypothetical protein M9H77_26585 [Catharanthus roseus]|uniref:Uncharacterized protein n=1 Tax=Catharanthus roseus TaxID=4058 RepID=A0ACC0AA33_CATRO|nr:hypothetical protein M9H77_26585 [Catharanthus roseus]